MIKVKILPTLFDYVEDEGWSRDMNDFIGQIITVRKEKHSDYNYVYWSEDGWYFPPDCCEIVPPELEYI